MIIDLVFVILLILSVFKGYRRGLIVGVFSLIAIIIGLAAAIKLSAMVAAYIGSHSTISEKWLPVISFAVVFIIAVLLVRLGANLIQKAVESVSLGWVNRLGGILLYAILFTMVYSILLFYASQVSLLSDATVKKSVIYPYVQPWGPKVIGWIASFIPFFRDMFTELQIFFGGVAQKMPQ
jgi:membrane protein required for colicin V production